MKTILVPRSHFNDFQAHLGWWAMQSSADLSIGDRVQFDLEGAPVDYMRTLHATITRISTGTIGQQVWLNAPKSCYETLPSSFVGWIIIEFDGQFDVPAPELGSGEPWNAWIARCAEEDEARNRRIAEEADVLATASRQRREMEAEQAAATKPRRSRVRAALGRLFSGLATSPVLRPLR